MHACRSTLEDPTGLLQEFLRTPGVEGCRSLKQVVSGSDVLPRSLEQTFFEKLPWAKLYNQYGPTETTVDVTCFECTPHGDRTTVPLGGPISNVKLYVLDANKELLPAGVVGELYVGGAGVARGYVDQPLLTAQKFVPSPFDDGERLYRTGDLASWRADGTLEFAGRSDTQVKVRGHRVELGEVEAALRAQPQVADVAVVLRGEELVAYLVGEALVAARIRETLGKALPEYMVPRVVVLPALPLSPSGKVDRRALPAPEQARPPGAPARVLPRNSIEQKLADIFERTLGTTGLSVEDSFFDLGGHSLMALRLLSRVRSELGVDLPLRQLYEHPTVAALAPRLEHAPAVQGHGPPELVLDPVNAHSPFPLTEVQQAYWIGRAAAFELGDVATHAYVEFELDGVELPRLDRALMRVIERHPMLRAIITPDGLQQTLPLSQIPPHQTPFLDLSGWEAPRREDALLKLRAEMSQRVFSPETWPLFDLRVTRVAADGRARLHIGLDGLIADDVSTRILARDLICAYEQPELPLAPLTLTFRDHVVNQIRRRGTRAYARALTYWKGRLESLPPAPELPQRLSGQKAPTFVRRTALLPGEAWTRLGQRAAQGGLSPSSVLIAAFAQTLAVWSRQPRFTLTLTLFNRPPLHPEMDQVVGDFTSLLLLEVDASGRAPFQQFARDLQRRLLEDLDHSEVSGVTVLRELARGQGAATRARFPVVFTSALSTYGPSAGLPRPNNARYVYGASQTSQVSLDAQVLELNGGLCVNWDAVDALFPDGVVDDLFEGYVDRLRHLSGESPEGWLERPPSFVPPSQLEARVAANQTQGPLDSTLMHSLVSAAAARDPGAPAVFAVDRTVTYAELERAARGLGHRLRDAGARPNTLVAIVLEKGWEQVVAALAIQHAGAAYVPISPDLPKERRWLLLASAGVRWVLTTRVLADALEWPGTVERLIVDEQALRGPELPPLAPAQKPEDLAYVIFTSGSTGQPKGVMIDHRGAVNTVLDVNQRFGVGPRDRVLALSSLSFDLSVYDLFGLLAAGGAVVMLDPTLAREPLHWAERVESCKVTLWNSVPALMQLFLDAAQTRSAKGHLRLCLLSGDWVPLALPERVREWAPEASVISLGGATEASIWSILFPVERPDPSWASVPYGKPMRNQTFHVLDEALEPRPNWVPGQLYIGGVGLAKGYWDDPERTRQAFLEHPVTGERLYKTGDLGRYLPDGNIEFLGREDFQVKVQGHRVELGEIEGTLLARPELAAAVVMVLPQRGQQRLVGYFVTKPGQSVTASQLLAHLHERLPDYMVPAVLLSLATLPVTANGKVDRRALPDPFAQAGPKGAGTPPGDLLEQQVAQIWKEVLNLEDACLEDDFFERGGTSLSAMQLTHALRKSLGRSLPMASLFQDATLGAICQVLRQPKTPPSHLVVLKPGAATRPLYLFHPINGSVFCYGEFSQRLPAWLPVYGVHARGMEDDGEPLSDLEEMARLYVEELIRFQPTGAFRLGGWSLGGLIAHEVAIQLTARGREVEIVIQFDTQFFTESPYVDDAAMLLHVCGMDERPPWTPDEQLSSQERMRRALDLVKTTPLPASHRSWSRAHQQPSGSMSPGGLHLEEAARLLHVHRCHDAAQIKYAPRVTGGHKPFDGRVLYFIANEWQSVGPRDRADMETTLSLWRGMCRQLEVQEVDGCHGFLFRDPRSLSVFAGTVERLFGSGTPRPMNPTVVPERPASPGQVDEAPSDPAGPDGKRVP